MCKQQMLFYHNTLWQKEIDIIPNIFILIIWDKKWQNQARKKRKKYVKEEFWINFKEYILIFCEVFLVLFIFIILTSFLV